MSETFGPYQLLQKVAQGGMAEVFLASRKGEIGGFSKRMAIKRIYQHLAEDPQLITMFFDEARIAAQFNHPNIVQIYNLGEIDGYFYIAMEYVHGRDLRSICERGLQVHHFLPLDLAVKIVAESACGLHYAHSQRAPDGSPLNVVHRDVSPQNVLIDMNGNIKVCDFGIARAEARLGETRTGQFKGKFAYMSPEQVIGDGKVFDHRSDIFSLGIILYEITVCTRLFRGKNDYDTIRLVADSDVPPPSSVRQGFPLTLEHIILKALQKDPDDRYQTARQMQIELEDWLIEQRAKSSPHHIAHYMESIFPELMDHPVGADSTLERDASEIAASLGKFTLPESVAAAASEASEATAVQDPALFGEATQKMMEPVRDGFDEEAEMEQTGAIDIDRFKQELAQDHHVSTLPTPTNPFGHHTQAPSPFQSSLAAHPLQPASWLAQPAAPQPSVQPEAPAEPLHADTTDTIPPASSHLIATAPGTPLKSPASRPEHLAALNYDEVSASFPRHPRSQDTLPPQTLAAPSTPRPDHDAHPAAQTQAPTPPPGWDVADESLGADFASLQGGKRKAFTLLAALALLGGLGVLIYEFGPEREEPVLADPLANVAPEQLERTPPLPLERRSVRLETNPPGAFVVINGIRTPGTTPGEFALAPGKNDVSFYLEGYTPLRAMVSGAPGPVTLNKAETIDPAQMATLVIETEPIGATLYHNGQAVGATPITLEGLDPEADHHVWVEQKGFYPYAALIRPIAGRQDVVRMILDPDSRASLAFTTQFSLETVPRGGYALVDGTTVGVTPTLHRLDREQKVTVNLQAPNHKDFSAIVESRAVGTFLVRSRLEPILVGEGKISLSVPKDTKQLYVGNNAYGDKPLKAKAFKGGTYTVVLELSSGKRVEATLEVEPEVHARYEAEVSDGKLRLKAR